TTQSKQNATLFSSRRNWDSPTSSPAGVCVPPSFGSGGTLARGRGGGGANSDEGTDTVVF
ncbi:MAG: hypothetical protein ACK56I_26745, partial [bacterium]